MHVLYSINMICQFKNTSHSKNVSLKYFYKCVSSPLPWCFLSFKGRVWYICLTYGWAFQTVILCTLTTTHCTEMLLWWGLKAAHILEGSLILCPFSSNSITLRTWWVLSFLWDSISVYSSSWPWTHDIPAYVSQIIGMYHHTRLATLHIYSFL